MLIVNTPHNPVGKVFTKTELEGIAALAEEFNFLVMSDEVVCIPRHVIKNTDHAFLATSTTALHLTVRSIYGLLTFLVCGIEPSVYTLLEVCTYAAMILELPLKTNISEAFAATGWRIGWLIGPAHLIQPTLAACRRIVYSSNTPMQAAVAVSLDIAKQNNFFEIQRAEYEERRNVLMSTFDELGLKYTIPAGTYFALLVREDILCPRHE